MTRAQIAKRNCAIYVRQHIATLHSPEKPMQDIKRWSSLEDDILVRGMRAQEDLDQVAHRLGRRSKDVEERLVELGLMASVELRTDKRLLRTKI